MKLISFSITLFIVLTLPNSTPDNKQNNIKPNILFILIDDQRDDVLSCAGHEIVKTPTVDGLAEFGMRFTNAFVTTSICAASRASILTGLYESRHNYTFGTPPLKMEYVLQSYPYLLKKSGYNTGFIGKLGVKLENQDSILTEMFDYCKLSPRSTPYFELLPNGKRVHSSEIKGDQAIDYINKQTAGQPFCLSISFNAVHAVDGNLTPGNEGHFPYPDAVAHLYEDLTMPPPELSDPQIFENHPEFLKTSMNRIRYFWRWDTEEKYQVNMKAYFRMISGYDYVMKKILDTLKEKGLDKNTIIIFSSDNGYYMGNRGFSGKWTHYEESLRVPLIIFDPRIKNEKSSKTSDKIALNIDIPATILDYADVSIPEIYQGKSLVRIVQSETVANWRNYFFCEHRMENKDIPKFKGIHGERYVYVNYYEQNPPYEFLHDLAMDKKELINLAKNPDYQTVIDELRTRTINMESEIRNKK